jgi:hypothetical protein
VYEDEEDEYFTFITPEAYLELENGKSIEYTCVGVGSSVSQCSESNYNCLNILLANRT